MGEVEEEKHAEDRAGRSEAFLFISWTVGPRHKSINDDYSAKKLVGRWLTARPLVCSLGARRIPIYVNPTQPTLSQLFRWRPSNGRPFSYCAATGPP